MSTPAQDTLTAQTAATIAIQTAAGQKIQALEAKNADLNNQITTLKAQIAALPADDSPLLTQLAGELKQSTDALQADIQAAA